MYNVEVDLFSEHIGASILNDGNRTISGGGNLEKKVGNGK